MAERDVSAVPRAAAHHRGANERVTGERAAGGCAPVAGAQVRPGRQISGLEQAVEACRGRLDDEVVDPAATIVAAGRRPAAALRRAHRGRARRRHRLRQVLDVQRADRSRPRRGRRTTPDDVVGHAPASGAARRVPRTCSSGWASRCGTRPRATRCSTRGRDARDLEGLVLLDLPDHDSTEVSHHLEVRAADRAGRPDDLGARPAEVRRQGGPRAASSGRWPRTRTS